jgi:pimeloyl-ACP methyl ester carboxylesterase
VERTLLLAAMGPFDDPRLSEGMNPVNRALIRVARVAPFLIRPLVAPFGLLARHGELVPRLAARLEAGAPEPDRRAAREPDYAVRKGAVADAFRQGSGPAAHELSLFLRPWGFALGEVEVPVHLWHGRLDTNVPFRVGEAMARELPEVTTHFHDDAAHLVGFEHRDEVMAAALG